MAFRDEERRLRAELPQGRQVEMIVVRVGQQDGVDPRQIAERARGRRLSGAGSGTAAARRFRKTPDPPAAKRRRLAAGTTRAPARSPASRRPAARRFPPAPPPAKPAGVFGASGSSGASCGPSLSFHRRMSVKPVHLVRPWIFVKFSSPARNKMSNGKTRKQENPVGRDPPPRAHFTFYRRDYPLPIRNQSGPSIQDPSRAGARKR